MTPPDANLAWFEKICLGLQRMDLSSNQRVPSSNAGASTKQIGHLTRRAV
jgi:hypothetical protein